MRQNAWNVIFFKEGKKYIKVFEGEKPGESGAITYAKKLKARGIIQVEVVSRRKAFGPPLAKQHPPQEGLLWCPYCLKWREFTERAIRTNGLLGPMVWRCPVCTISVNDYHIRRFNVVMVARLDHRSRTRVPSEKEIRKTIHRR